MGKRYVYLLKTPENIYKIGVAKNVDKRIKSLQTGSADKIILVDKFLSEYPFKIESTLHRKYSNNNIKGEWYYLTNENINNFQKDCSLMENNFKCMEKFGNPYI